MGIQTISFYSFLNYQAICRVLLCFRLSFPIDPDNISMILPRVKLISPFTEVIFKAQPPSLISVPLLFFKSWIQLDWTRALRSYQLVILASKSFNWVPASYFIY
jgi:hypothetical protein